MKAGEEQDWQEVEDGPGFWPHALALGVRLVALALVPVGLVGLIAVIDVMEGSSLSRATEPLVASLVISAFGVALIALVIPLAAEAGRRRRDLSLARGGAGRRVGWSATFLQPSGAFPGSLHLSDGWLRFLWHRPQALDGKFQFDQEVALRLEAEKVAAVEVIGASGVWEALRYGTHQVAVLLQDGRRLRFAAVRPRELAATLERELGRPAGTPVAPEVASALDRASLQEVGDALVRKNDLVALVVKSPGGGERYVVLHGEREELSDALARASAALAAEDEATRPFLEARGVLPRRGQNSQ